MQPARPSQAPPAAAPPKPFAASPTKKVPPRPPAPKPGHTPGTKITVEVLTAEGRQFTLRDTATGQADILLDSPVPLPWTVGQRHKVRVEKVDKDGRVLKVKP